MSTELSAVCRLVKGGLDPQRHADTSFAHYSIPAFDSGRGPVIELGGNIHSQKTPIPGDVVLVSKLNPRIPRVWHVNDDQSHQRICSTEFVALQPDYTVLEPAYLSYALREALQAGFIKGDTAAATKSRERAKPSDFLRLRVRIPPLSEQRRIVDLLLRAENIVRMRREAEQKAKEIIPALFLDMFGDPATNPKGWDIRPLGDILRSIDFGLSVALSKDVDFKPGRTGVLRIANITANGHLDLTDVRYIKVSDNHRTRLDLRAGDLLFNWRNSPKWVGKTAFVANGLEHTFASFLYRLRASPERADSHYVWRYLNLLRERGVFESMCRQAVSQANLGRDELASVRVMVAPLERQQSFGKWCVHLWGVEAQLARATWTAETAFQSLLAGVFGER